VLVPSESGLVLELLVPPEVIVLEVPSEVQLASGGSLIVVKAKPSVRSVIPQPSPSFPIPSSFLIMTLFELIFFVAVEAG